MPTQTAATASFAERVTTRTAGPARLLLLPTPAQEVVSWRGSFLTHPDIAAGEELLQELTVSLLDKGTATRDRFALARVLEDCGAQLRLSNNGLRVHVSGRALRSDLPAVMEVLAEMLTAPRFTEEEFEKAQAQAMASLQRQMDDTGAQASGALTRALYPPAHPNHSAAPEDLLAQVQSYELNDVQAYHAAHFGAQDVILALAGDLVPDEATATVADAFGDWPAGDAPAQYAANARSADAGHSAQPMPDKANVDVRMGQALDVRRDDDAYLPLYLANYVLGGNFSARLMASVRDEQGLTYGIRSSLSGIDVLHDGHWMVSVTLSQDALDEGLAATRAEVERFAEGGITADELAEKKTTLTGSFKVGLATTGRLAHSLLANAERGFDVAYLDDFPGLINGLTLEQVNAAVAEHFHPEQLHTALAGTLPDAAPVVAS